MCRNLPLGFTETEPECHPLAPLSGKEWLRSELDDISHDLFGPLADGPALGKTSPEYSRQYRNQYRLVNIDGFVALQPPHLKCSSPPRTAIIPTSGEDRESIILTVPVEVRLCIYRLLLVSNCCPDICPDPTGLRILSFERNNPLYGLHPQVLGTCRQINREGTSILYSENLFQLQSYWRTRYTRSGPRLWSRSDSSPLKNANLESVTRVCLFRGYNRWLSSSRELRVLWEFPSLRRLRVRVDLNDVSHGVDFITLWKDTIESVSRHRPGLACFEAQLRLAFGREDYRAWLQRCGAKPLDFSIHRAKKIEFEEWMLARHLFEGQELAWSFTTETSQWVGPSCVIAFAVESGHPKTQADKIQCMIEGDYDTKMSLEPI
ncbi:uncharacterized protein AUP68_10797 [Ilyonectria robusta]